MADAEKVNKRKTEAKQRCLSYLVDSCEKLIDLNNLKHPLGFHADCDEIILDEIVPWLSKGEKKT